MPNAAIALQQAIFSTLSGSSGLLALLGGPRIYDDAPQSPPFPYVTIGQSSERDWSTGTETGAEHTVTLHAWSRTAGKKQIAAILAELRASLHDQPLTLDGHRLVNLRHELSELRRDADGDTYHGLVRYRAVTEPA